MSDRKGGGERNLKRLTDDLCMDEIEMSSSYQVVLCSCLYKFVLVIHRKTVMRTTLSILRVLSLFFDQKLSNSVIDDIETLRDALKP